ncbi:MAG: hypothetical protein MUF54_17860, partial [Polyangiaceae bacterium]|nr:hypothetical protein [Polyangiaceae bacterium]
MRFPSQFRLVAVGLFAIFACSPAQPAATPSTSAPTAPSTSAQPQPDLSPAAEPPGVVLLMRVRNPSESLQAADRIARLPTSLGALAREALHAAKLDVLKLDASVDAVLVLDPTSGDGDPKFMAAASLPLSDLEGARAAMQRAGADFQPMVPGVYRGVIAPEHTASEPTNIEESQADDDAPEQTDARNTVQCDLAASVGDAPARVVCADTVDELNALRPWMTRGLPTAPPNTEDFWLAVRFGPLRDKYLPVMRSQTTGLELLASQWLTRELGIQDPALLRVPGQLVEEAMLLVDDLDCVTVTADLDAAGPRADFRGELAFRSKS